MTDTDDPFHPDADPNPPRVSRRSLALALVAVPAVACAPRRPTCAPVPPAGSCCPARFCRYYATRGCAELTPSRADRA
ncbi:MAG: hypothetical protein IT377_27005 [Polyangiaceae bacterium]|nr:hypothetical protein [Polyangiaceae bacterium]